MNNHMEDAISAIAQNYAPVREWPTTPWYPSYYYYRNRKRVDAKRRRVKEQQRAILAERENWRQRRGEDYLEAARWVEAQVSQVSWDDWLGGHEAVKRKLEDLGVKVTDSQAASIRFGMIAEEIDFVHGVDFRGVYLVIWENGSVYVGETIDCIWKRLKSHCSRKGRGVIWRGVSRGVLPRLVICLERPPVEFPAYDYRAAADSDYSERYSKLLDDAKGKAKSWNLRAEAVYVHRLKDLGVVLNNKEHVRFPPRSDTDGGCGFCAGTDTSYREGGAVTSLQDILDGQRLGLGLPPPAM